MTDKHTKRMATALPSIMPKDPASGNYALLDVVGESLTELDTDITDIDKAASVQEATSIKELKQLGKMVQTPPREGEALESYRARLLVQFALNSAGGRVNETLNIMASVLRVESSSTRYQDWWELYGYSGACLLFPYDGVQASPLAASDIPSLIRDIVGAGKEVTAQYTGTFTPVSASEYQSTDWTGYEHGAGTLDGGSPADSGGTVGGLID